MAQAADITAAEIASQARDRALQCVRDESGPEDHAADEAAYYASLASKLLYGVEGEEAADPKGAHRSLIKAQGHLRAALRIVEQEQVRLCFAYGLDDGTEAPVSDPARAA